MTDIYTNVISVFNKRQLAAIQDSLILTNKNKGILDSESRLKEQHYLSPQNVPFACGTCDHYVKVDGFCRALKCYVEKNGCCNIWKHNGVEG